MSECKKVFYLDKYKIIGPNVFHDINQLNLFSSIFVSYDKNLFTMSTVEILSLTENSLYHYYNNFFYFIFYIKQ